MHFRAAEAGPKSSPGLVSTSYGKLTDSKEKKYERDC